MKKPSNPWARYVRARNRATVRVAIREAAANGWGKR